jgi:hypothetical protein
MLREIVSSLRGSWAVCKLTRHFRAGLSHTADSQLDYQLVQKNADSIASSLADSNQTTF